MRDAGPYRVLSSSDGTLKVYPEWHEYPGIPSWQYGELHDGDYSEWPGGGPGMFSRMGLAHDLQRYLNSPYPPRRPVGCSCDRNVV